MTEAKPILSNGGDEMREILAQEIARLGFLPLDRLERDGGWIPMEGAIAAMKRVATPAPSPVVGEGMKEPLTTFAWQSIETYQGVPHQVDLWLNIPATPRSMGWADAFRVIECWLRSDGKWVHADRGEVKELYQPYITHWMPLPPPPSEPASGSSSISPPHPTEDLGGPQASPAWKEKIAILLESLRAHEQVCRRDDRLFSSSLMVEAADVIEALLQGREASGSPILPNELDSLMSAQRELVIEEAARVVDDYSGLFDIPSPDDGPFTQMDKTIAECKLAIAKAIRSLSTTKTGEGK